LPESPQVIGGLSGKVALRARMSSLAFLARYLRKMSWLQVQGEGNLSGEVALERGRLLPGSRLAIDLGRLRARILDSEADGAATLRAEVHPGPAPELRLGVAFSRFVLQPAGVPATPWVRGSGLKLGFASRDLDLGAPVQDLRGTVELADGEVPDLAVYNAYLPPEAGLAVISGRGRLGLRLRLDAGSGDGDLTLTSDDLQARFLDLHLGGRLRLAAHLAEADLERRRFALGGTRLDLTDIAYAEEGQSPRVEDAGWWARVQIPRGTLVWSKPLAIQGRIEARLRDAGLLLSLFAQRSRFLDWFDSLIHVDDVQVRGDLQMGNGVVQVDPFRATGDNLDLRSRLRLAAGSRQGDLYVRYKKLKVGIALRDGERAFKLRRPEEWFESRGRVDE
jgi:translocation and assembly module TamB